MATLCSICQDYLTERPQALRAEEDVIMCALTCGHLFHRVCVSQWFNRALRWSWWANLIFYFIRDGICPCCKKNVSLNNALRVYPTGDEEGDRMVRQDRDLKKVTEENLRLHAQQEELRQQLQRARSTLEEEVVAHDILKMEYGQAASRCETMQNELQDGKDMKLAIENSYKSALEKSEGEKTDALQRLTEMETQHDDTLGQVQQLKKMVEKLQLQDARRRQENQYLQASLFSKDAGMEKLPGKQGASKPTAGRLLMNGRGLSEIDAEPELVAF
ncbi:E3 ubiquitin-protein ligase TRAIP [Orchesella cincta]|uniref:E3 ubiquitin-protein ligase TRAIP n=1 Tax=Orchesella cincta TaxID=48709 RepID=A0A1D2MSK1_ORCCI|nr:E3 ubiquitin-protein ligase TRAIP [Orchesella cincta]